MANKSLTDLTARTATADSDLIHVNSGGTDYKEQKIDFLHGDFSRLFDNTTSLTGQAEALPTDGTYYGRILGYGHQSETGLPINAHCYVKVSKNTSSTIFVEVWSTADAEGAHYSIIKTSNVWGSWKQIPTRAEITSLKNSLTNSSIAINAGTPAVTITRNNSYKWGNIIIIAVRFNVTSAIAIYGYVAQIPSNYLIVSDVYAPLMSSYFTTMADKGIYADAGSYTLRASSAIPTGSYTVYVPVLVRNA